PRRPPGPYPEWPGTSAAVLPARPSGRDRGLTEREPAVVRWNPTMTVDLEVGLLKCAQRGVEQPRVLEDATAQRDRVDSGARADSTTDLDHHIDERRVEACRDRGRRDLAEKIFHDPADNVPRAYDQCAIGVRDASRIDPVCTWLGHGLELHRRLPFELDAV